VSVRSAPARRTASSGARRRPRTAARRRQVLRRRLALLGVVVLGAMVAYPLLHKAVEEIQLPLRHEDIIRQQAEDKDLDPALIAAVIYTESHFRDQTSTAGAKGLMQLMPATADYIADKSGGTQFERGDLARPQINIAYGSFYLRYLLDKYQGNDLLALAAYNAGEGKVDQWIARASDRGEVFRSVDHIPFPETRQYVGKVLDARISYRREYRRELGL
jgi:soluble lytic murein transglycosylase